MRASDFAELVVPILEEKWQRRCFCRSPGFLKLLSFDSADYRQPVEGSNVEHHWIAPVELLDSELIWSAIVGKRFLPRGDWSRVSGGHERVFECPQCLSPLRARSVQYGINMWPTTTRPTDARHMSESCVYLVGFHAFTGKFDPAWITDFGPANSVDDFIESVTASG